MTTDALFEGHDERLPEPPKMTRGEALRARQQARIDAGQHPLAYLVAGGLPLLPEPGRMTCGMCAHRVMRRLGGSYPKCDVGSRATGGESSDVRAWWPACVDFEDKP